MKIMCPSPNNFHSLVPMLSIIFWLEHFPFQGFCPGGTLPKPAEQALFCLYTGNLINESKDILNVEHKLHEYAHMWSLPNIFKPHNVVVIFSLLLPIPCLFYVYREDFCLQSYRYGPVYICINSWKIPFLKESIWRMSWLSKLLSCLLNQTRGFIPLLLMRLK